MKMSMSIKRRIHLALYAMRMMLPKSFAHRIVYFQQHRRFPNFKKPKTYDEKIHWHSVHTFDESFGKYVDKYEVRKYVENCGLKDILIPLVGVYENADEINFADLPERFILKANHASGEKFYAICEHKDQFDTKIAVEKMRYALSVDFSYRFCEYQYKGIKTKILCEKLLTVNDNERMDDYKVVCHYGKPECILVCTNRDKGRDYYSAQWEYLDYVQDKYRGDRRIKKPVILNQMLNAAAVLSKPFPLARVDFYIVKDKLYFGEITLTPSTGDNYYLNELGQNEIGAMIPVQGLKQ